MSAVSRIPIQHDLQQAFATAQHSDHRFLKLVIRDETIVLDSTTPIQDDFSTDLHLLQNLLEDDVPAYVLAKLDNSSWLAITYVPETAKVRDKMIYASFRNLLTKSLGSASFLDIIFATHKSDLTPAAYAAHRRHQTAPKPLSAREQDLAEVQAAERAAFRSSNEVNAAGKNHFGGASLQIRWSHDSEKAVQGLASSGDDECRLVVMSIDPVTETLVVSSNKECTPSDIGASLPSSDPSYAFFLWTHAQRSDIVFIYSCPSGSPIKHRIIFSSGVSSVLAAAKDLGASVAKKVETSDPQELNEAFLLAALSLPGSEIEEEKKPFAKPRGPVRKQR